MQFFFNFLHFFPKWQQISIFPRHFWKFLPTKLENFEKKNQHQFCFFPFRGGYWRILTFRLLLFTNNNFFVVIIFFEALWQYIPALGFLDYSTIVVTIGWNFLLTMATFLGQFSLQIELVFAKTFRTNFEWRRQIHYIVNWIVICSN